MTETPLPDRADAPDSPVPPADTAARDRLRNRTLFAASFATVAAGALTVGLVAGVTTTADATATTSDTSSTSGTSDTSGSTGSNSSTGYGSSTGSGTSNSGSSASNNSGSAVAGTSQTQQAQAGSNGS